MHFLQGPKSRSLSTGLAAFISLASALFADTPAPGYSLEALSYPGRSATATLSDGRIVVFDGLRVVLAPETDLASTGRARIGATKILTELPGFVFASFVVVDPSESYCVIGESLNGELFVVDLRRGGRRLLTTLAFNYDAVFEDEEHLLVSAAVRGFGAGNDVLRVELTTGIAVSVVQVPGASGPIAVTAEGDLLYGTASLSFPAPPGSSDVLRWSALQLGTGNLLTELDAATYGSGFNGASSLTVDLEQGAVFLAENNFGTGENRILRVASTKAMSEVVVEGRSGRTIGSLEVVCGNKGGRFAAYQPKSRGGLLRYNTTDFFSSWERTAVRTQRPIAFASGPGATVGVGPFTWTVENGPPSGIAIVLWAPSAALSLPESAYSIGVPGDPLFLGVSPGLLGVLSPVSVALDAMGRGSAAFTNPLGVPDAVVLYGLVGTLGVEGVTSRVIL